MTNTPYMEFKFRNTQTGAIATIKITLWCVLSCIAFAAGAIVLWRLFQ